jgi:hypothetical protein
MKPTLARLDETLRLRTHGRCAVRPDLICRTAVYVTRSYGGVGGGGREAFPYPEWASRSGR